MRSVLACACAVGVLLPASVLASPPDLAALEATLTRIIDTVPGEGGVSVIHVESGAHVAVNGDRRFPMASVYKLPIAIELLTQAGEGMVDLDGLIAIGRSDIRACCTLSRRHPNGGVTLTVRELLTLMMTESDNTSGDALLRVVGGPPSVERRMRALGFPAINVNRYEGHIALDRTGVVYRPPENEWTLALQYQLFAAVSPAELRAARARYTSDPRDSATPNDMARLLVRLHRGELLSPLNTHVLLDLMSRAKTGPRRLKGLLPPETVVAHKTGTTDVVCNDVGIIALPDQGGHVAVATFATNGRPAAMQSMIARLGGAVYETFTGKPLPPPKEISKPKKAKANAKAKAKARKPIRGKA